MSHPLRWVGRRTARRFQNVTTAFEAVANRATGWRPSRHRQLRPPVRRSRARSHVVFIQYGDFEEAQRRLARGGAANYYAQRYTIRFLEELASTHQVTVIGVNGQRPTTRLESGIEVRGFNLRQLGTEDRVIEALEELRPDHLVLSLPSVEILGWAVRKGVDVLPILADSFRGRGWMGQARARQFALLLDHPQVAFVANHGLAASRELMRIGVRPDKILPFDWPSLVDTRRYPPKRGPAEGETVNIILVGQLRADKGVLDALESLALLLRSGRRAKLTLIGDGDIEMVRCAALRLGVMPEVDWKGTLSHAKVLAAVRKAHVALVPSHHVYPEAKPMTLFEALAVKTPIVMSDHPMFVEVIERGRDGLVVPEKDPQALAEAIESLVVDPVLYEALSRNGGYAAERFFCDLEWKTLLSWWLDRDRRDDLGRYSLAESSPARAA